jgi:eukaryotic-like serine/threonine-protein kinase
MHRTNETLSPGAIVGDHYLVVDVIGKGGFSAVYLVQDQQQEEKFFALKEVIAAHKEARERFIFECTLLERLIHPSLPRVYNVFNDEEHNCLYMLMDYVEGPNLEVLRRVQHGRRFSLPIVTAILTPVVDAIAYLHKQDPPVIHRDIKPANIIVPVAGGKATLVDFGIAKEYDTLSTTSAVRYGSPGYGAPEHYTMGTNVRSDVYGLGATLYTLLTSEVPPEAIERMTQISNEDIDPLKPANELVPTIPLHISQAIQRALSIKITQRFASVQEFWQVVQQGSEEQPSHSQALDKINISSAGPGIKKTEIAYSRKAQEKPHRSARKGLLLCMLLALLVLVVVGTGLWRFTGLGGNPHTTSAVGTVVSLHPPTLSPIATAPPSKSYAYPRLATSYTGTIVDLQANVPSQMTLAQMQQNSGRISGLFIAMHMKAPYTGFLDVATHIYFTVAASGGSASLNFTGSIQKNGILSGSFCQVDQNGQCAGSVFGLWRVAPAG